MIDLHAVRADTAGCEGVIHLNNAGSSLPLRPVVDAVVDYLREEELTGGYETAAARVADLDAFYTQTASFIGAGLNEVAFTSSASDAWWRAFMSVKFEKGDKILVSRSEFQANAYGWLRALEQGIDVEVVPNTPAGDFDLDAFDTMLDDRVALVSFTMISMSNGAVHPAADVGRRLADHRAIYLLDACQAAGQLRLDVNELGCDFMVYTGRKFMRGPRGTGVLYARKSVLPKLGPPVFLDGRSATWTGAKSYELAEGAQRFEFGEYSYAGKVGLGVATAYVNDLGIDDIEERIAALSSQFRLGLESIDRVQILDQGTIKSGIVTFNVGGVSAGDVHAHLKDNSINLSAPGQANAQLDLGPRGIGQLLRAGVHYFNTETELGRTLEVLDGISK